ncbi:hypothetical protein BGY98DRAFT_935576 [Russula aff. rugulosa BPL654]|nr:hypothetical protein BGY98DRAFT_935576 [Russula aff. rugulosa BPL654]
MASSSSSNFQSIFDASLQSYNDKTNNKLLDHPLATQLQSCDSPNAVLSVLQDLVQQFDQRRNSDERLNDWLNPTVNVLYTFSATLSDGVACQSQLAILHDLVIFAGIGVLLLAAKDVNASQGMLVDLFERIESFFKRLECHTELKPSKAMTDMMVKSWNDVEDALKRLDKLTQEEAKMATAEVLKITRGMDSN